MSFNSLRQTNKKLAKHPELSKHNKEVLNDFFRKAESGGAGKSTLQDYSSRMNKLAHHIDFFIERTIYDLFFNDLANAIGDGQRELRQINQSDKDIETGLNENLDLETDESIDPESPVSENMLILTKIMKLVAPDSIRFHGAELYVMEYLEMDEPAKRLPHS